MRELVQTVTNKQSPYIFSWVFSEIRTGWGSKWSRWSLSFPWGRPEKLRRWIPSITKLWVIRRSALITGPLCSAGGSGVEGWLQQQHSTSVLTEPALMMHTWVWSILPQAAQRWSSLWGWDVLAGSQQRLWTDEERWLNVPAQDCHSSAAPVDTYVSYRSIQILCKFSSTF